MAIQLTLAVILRAIVAVPVDMGRGLCSLILVDRFQLDGVSILSGLNDIGGLNNSTVIIASAVSFTTNKSLIR